MTTALLNQSLAEIVNKDFRAAKVFDKYGLDFCCRGKQTLSEACEQKVLAPDNVVADLAALLNAGNNENRYANFSNEQLINHIVTIHHQFIRESVPLILKFLNKVSNKHGDRYPYMRQVFVLFLKLGAELESHLEKEEKTVFPLISRPAGNEQQLLSLFLDMEQEHDGAGTLMEQIRTLSNDYDVPAQACGTFRTVLQLLEQFETDLHTHVFIENHILFPRITNLN